MTIGYLKNLLKSTIEKRRYEEKEEAVIRFYEEIYKIQEDGTSIKHERTKISTLQKHYSLAKNDIGILKGALSELSDTGMVLYYDKGILSDYVWLNPTALVEYVHEKILTKDLVGKGSVEKQNFEATVNDNVLIEMLKENKVIFFDSHQNEYIIPNYLPIVDENSDDFFIFRDYQAFDLSLKFENFIPFGYINRLICFFGQNPDRKTYRRNQLVFTMENKLKIMIHLDFEKLMINVACHPIKDFVLPSTFLRGFLYELLALYHNDSIGFGNETMKEKNMIKEKKDLNDINKAFITIDDYTNFTIQSQNKIKIPKDLYISLNQKDFVNFDVLENEDTKESILSFQLDEKGNINGTKAKTISTYGFKNISFNQNLKSMKKIFVSYSRQDVYFRDELRKYLNFAKIFGVLDHWACEDITIGNWDEQIQKELREADLVIMMMSIDFFNSRYILEKEILETIKQIENGANKKIYPIMVKHIPNIDNLIKNSTDETKLKDALAEVAKHQYGVYDTESKTDGQPYEKIFTLNEFLQKGKLDYALSKIVDKIVTEI